MHYSGDLCTLQVFPMLTNKVSCIVHNEVCDPRFKYFLHKMQCNGSYACFYTTNIPIKTCSCINYYKCPSFACKNMDFSNTCK